MSSGQLLEYEQNPIQIQDEIEQPEQDDDYNGRKLNRELQQGPIKHRKFQDLKYASAYLGIWALMIYSAIRLWKDGDISKIYMPYDSQQRQCGKGLLINFPNIYIYGDLEFYCVSRCPGENDFGKELPCYDCSSKIAPYPSEKIVTLCYPTSNADEKYKYLISGISDITFVQQSYSDIKETWYIILGCIGFSFIISCLLLLLIRIAAGCIVWGMIVIYFLLTMSLGTVAFLQSQGYYQQYRMMDDSHQLEIIAYISWGIGGLSFIIIPFLTKKIKQAIIVLKVAADFAREEWQVMFVPIYCLILALGVFLYCAIFSAIIYSTSSYVNKYSNNPYFTLKLDSDTSAIICIHLLGLIWSLSYTLALCQFVTCSCCCIWYYSHQGYSVKRSILKSFCLGFTNSFGSLLYGSFILPTLWVIRKALGGLNYALFENSAKYGKKIRCLCVCGIECFMFRIYIFCFDKFIRFLNKNAYILMALQGKSYFDSAQDAFYLIRRNSIRVAITQGLGEVFSTLGVLFVSVSSTFICYLIITQNEYLRNNVIDPLIPTLFFFFFSLIVGSMFMNLFGMGVDTILICYIVDIEQNINQGGPKSQPKLLKQIADKLI